MEYLVGKNKGDDRQEGQRIIYANTSSLKRKRAWAGIKIFGEFD